MYISSVLFDHNKRNHTILQIYVSHSNYFQCVLIINMSSDVICHILVPSEMSVTI